MGRGSGTRHTGISDDHLARVRLTYPPRVRPHLRSALRWLLIVLFLFVTVGVHPRARIRRKGAGGGLRPLGRGPVAPATSPARGNPRSGDQVGGVPEIPAAVLLAAERAGHGGGHLGAVPGVRDGARRCAARGAPGEGDRSREPAPGGLAGRTPGGAGFGLADSLSTRVPAVVGAAGIGPSSSSGVAWSGSSGSFSSSSGSPRDLFGRRRRIGPSDRIDATKEPAASVEPTTSDLLRDARGALSRHAWQEAFELFSRADREGALRGPDLESLAEAAWFAAQAELATEAKERAFRAHLADGARIRAAYLALSLAHDYGFKRKPSIASAWFRRGERLLEGEEESYAHGYLALARSDAAREAGEVDTAVQLAEQAVQIGARAGDADLQAFAQTALGVLRIATGATSEGFALMEEASFAAVNGELSPFTTGVTYCSMIAACRDLTDFRRASEWTEATERWCERQSVAGFPGVCRVHRAEVVALSGAWGRAEEELRRATDELAAYNAIPPLSDGFYAIGEIRLRMGDLQGAEEALREAHALGRSPQPALALIRLAEGKVRAAAAAINSAVEQETWDHWARARLLPAQIEIAVAAGDRKIARDAAEELARLVRTYDSPAMLAGQHESWGRVLLAEGDAAGAARELRAAIRRWREVAAPYEVARSRALLAAALRAMDDEDGADLELRAAREEFVRLGARLDAAAAETAARAAAERGAAPTQTRRTFMFTDIVGSTNLAELLGNESWEHLLQWHDQALRALFAGSGGEVVNSTGDGFFVAFDSAREGVECAIAIQRALAEHRRSTGFASSVRIGLHAAEANRRGEDYRGMGVHVAARVAALAGAGEIVATAETLAEAGDVATSSPREASLKGVTAPVTVASVSWA
jgi:class 3 adenylate cyclase